MNKFQDIFDAQKALFASGATRTYEWRVGQLDRMAQIGQSSNVAFRKESPSAHAVGLQCFQRRGCGFG